MVGVKTGACRPRATGATDRITLHKHPVSSPNAGAGVERNDRLKDGAEEPAFVEHPADELLRSRLPTERGDPKEVVAKAARAEE